MLSDKYVCTSYKVTVLLQILGTDRQAYVGLCLSSSQITDVQNHFYMTKVPNFLYYLKVHSTQN